MPSRIPSMPRRRRGVNEIYNFENWADQTADFLRKVAKKRDAVLTVVVLHLRRALPSPRRPHAFHFAGSHLRSPTRDICARIRLLPPYCSSPALAWARFVSRVSSRLSLTPLMCILWACAGRGRAGPRDQLARGRFVFQPRLVARPAGGLCWQDHSGAVMSPVLVVRGGVGHSPCRH